MKHLENMELVVTIKTKQSTYYSIVQEIWLGMEVNSRKNKPLKLILYITAAWTAGYHDTL